MLQFYQIGEVVLEKMSFKANADGADARTQDTGLLNLNQYRIYLSVFTLFATRILWVRLVAPQKVAFFSTYEF